MNQYLVLFDARSPYSGQVFTVLADNLADARELAQRVVDYLPEQARLYHNVRSVQLLEPGHD